jgi:formate-dependent nitrite reductase membrane component NrfD
MVSGMSTGVATVMWMSKNHKERRILGSIDLVLIIIELFFITHMIMGMLAGSEVMIQAAGLFLGGQFTISFWVFVVILGLIFPAILEILELRGFNIPIAIPSLLILIGGLVFRFVMVEAGQITRYLY